MFNRSFLLSLGITTLSAAFLFIYFKNRISDVENKVQLIFDLVQSHQNNLNQQQYDSGLTVELKNETPQGLNQVVESSKIDISEDESSDDESDDSETDSDSENENTIENIDIKQNDEKIPDLVDTSEDLEVETLENDVKDKDQDRDINVENIQDLTEFALDNSLDESISLKNNLDEDSLDELSSLDENTIEEQEEKKKEEPQQELKKLTVPTLKTLAEKKGLTNYKSLKKAALIKLIQEN